MADIKITELDLIGTLQTGDLLPIVDINDFTQAPSGSTRKITIDLIQSFMQTNLTFLESGDNVSELVNDAGYLTTALQNGDVDLGYTAGTRTITNTAGDDTVLPLFTSTEAGLVPLSGGGTTNFLRADGTWASAGGDSIYTASSFIGNDRTVTLSDGATTDRLLTFAGLTQANLLKLDSINDRIYIGSATGTAKLTIVNPNGADRGITLRNATYNASDVNAFNFNQDDSGTAFIQNGGADAFRITTSQNVAVGAFTPSAKLHIGGNTYIDGELRIQDGTQGTIGHVWTSTGVNGEGSWQAAGGGADGNGIYDGSGSLSGATTVTMATNDLIFASTGEANLLNIDTTNNRVGIGLAPFGGVLHVGGDTRIDGLLDVNGNIDQDTGNFESTGYGFFDWHLRVNGARVGGNNLSVYGGSQLDNTEIAAFTNSVGSIALDVGFNHVGVAGSRSASHALNVTGNTNSTTYSVNGTAGANFSGAVTNITVVDGIVTAVS